MSTSKNIISNWANILISMASVFLLFPFMTKTLGEDQYGIWLYVTSVTGYFELLKLGVPLANVRFISKYLANNQSEDANAVISTNLVFFTLIGLVTLIMGLVASYNLEHVFAIPNEYLHSAKIAMVFAALNVSISFVAELFQGVMFALHDFVKINVLKSLIVMLRLLAFFMLVVKHNGIIMVSYIILFFTVVQGLFTFALAKRYFKDMRVRFRGVRKEIFSEVTKYSIFVMLLQLAGTMSFQTDAIVIGSFLSVSLILTFTIASNIMNYLMQFVVGISTVLMPKVSSLEAKNDTTAIADVYYKYCFLTFSMALPVCSFLVMSGGDFIAIWMGEQYRNSSGHILTILVGSYLFLSVQRGAAFPIFMGTSHMRFLSLLMLVTAVMNVFLSIWWGVSYGINGVAWGTTVPNLITVSGILWYMKKHFGINVLNFVNKTMLMPSLCATVFVVTNKAMRRWFLQDDYLILFITGIASTCAYLIFMRIFVVSHGIKAYLHETNWSKQNV